VDIAVYGAVRGTVENGLTPVRLATQGEGEEDVIPSTNAYGGQAEIGAYGTHAWQKAVLGLDYRGDYRRTTRRNAFNGVNQAMSLDLSYTPSRRTQFFFRESLRISNRAFGGFAAPSMLDPSSLNLPNDELFDTRIYSSQTNVGAAVRTSARLAYIFSGDYFFMKRPDTRLVSTSGYRASAAAEYRFNARSSMAVQYQHMNFVFKRVYGNSNIDGGLVTFTRLVNRNTSVSLTGGLMRVHTVGTQQVELSEEVAAILGRTRGVASFDRVDLVPQYSANLTYSWERSQFTTQYMAAVVPGNGVFLTSQMRGASAGYSFTGIRRLSMGVSARYATRETLAIASLQDQTTIAGGGGLNYALTRLFNISTQMDYRKFRTGGIRGREGYFIAVGLTVSPARLPLSIW
jgi:hypothetical protein